MGLGRELHNALGKLDSAENSNDLEKILTEINDFLRNTKTRLSYKELRDAIADDIMASFAFNYLFKDFQKLNAEGRKLAIDVLHTMMWYQTGTRSQADKELSTHISYIVQLIQGYESTDAIAEDCGQLLRDSLQKPFVAATVLSTDDPTFKLISLTLSSKENIALDVFQVLKRLLTANPTATAKFMTVNYDTFFEKYQTLLESSNLVVQKQAVELLFEVLTNHLNSVTFRKYLTNAQPLELFIGLMTEPSGNTTFEAAKFVMLFTMFPNKSADVQEVFDTNKDKLITVFTNLNKPDDEQFEDQKSFTLDALNNM